MSRRKVLVLAVPAIGLLALLILGLSARRATTKFIWRVMPSAIGEIRRRREGVLPPALTTNQYRLNVRELVLPFEEEGTEMSGPIDIVSDRALYVLTQSGRMFEVQADGADFMSSGGRDTITKIGSLGWSQSGATPPEGFGFKGLRCPSPSDCFASFVGPDAEHACMFLQIVRLARGPDGMFAVDRSLFRSPCAKTTGSRAALTSGGELALRADGTLLATVGDFALGDPLEPNDVASDMSTTLGKVISINLSSGAVEVFTRGHRNSQGLYVSASRGVVFATEQGPQGGDELNLLSAGGHYGWPHSTYGHMYSTLLPGASTSTDFSSRLAAALGSRPLGRDFGSHVTGVKPLLAWVPSIGISRMLEYECAPGDGSTQDSRGRAQGAAELSAWCGNLLIASLRGQTLHRVVLASEPDGTAMRVVVDEPIPLGRRMRGIRRFSNGSLVVKTDLPSLVFLWRLGT